MSSVTIPFPRLMSITNQRAEHMRQRERATWSKGVRLQEQPPEEIE